MSPDPTPADDADRADLLAGLREMMHGLSPADGPEFYAEDVVAWLEQQTEGWLFLGGKTRKVQIADRFGPASWEISTHEHPSDWVSWRAPVEPEDPA